MHLKWVELLYLKERVFSLFWKNFMLYIKHFHAVSMIALLITNIVILSAVGKIMSEAYYVLLESWRMTSSEIRTQPTLSIRWDSLEMRFTARSLGRGRRTISDICGGLPERDTPLDFTTREVVRETFHWRVWSLPLLVQITFRTLNLFREVGRRPLLRARVKVLRFLPSILFWYNIRHFHTRIRYTHPMFHIAWHKEWI